MAKVLMGLVAIFVIQLVLAEAALAREGRIVLKNRSVTCEGISIWRQTAYRISGRCAGLVYPYAEKVNQYVLWIVPEGDAAPVRVDNVEVGHFDGQTSRSFTRVLVTAEEESSPRNPSDVVVASGDVQIFDFTVSETLTPSPSPRAVTLRPSPTPSVTATTVSSNLRRLLTTVAIGVGVLGAVVVGLVVISRRG